MSVLKNNLILFFLLLLFTFSSDPSRTYVYNIETKKESETRILSIKKSEAGWVIEQTLALANEKIFVTADHQVTDWILIKTDKEIHIKGSRKGNEIILKGTKKGKPYERTQEIDDNPWFQVWEIGLDKFVVGAEKEIKFWSINPNMFKAGLLTAVKAGRKDIMVNGLTRSAEQVDISMKGFSPKLFSAIYWFDPGSGVLLKLNFQIFGTTIREVLMEVK